MIKGGKRAKKRTGVRGVSGDKRHSTRFINPLPTKWRHNIQRYWPHAIGAVLLLVIAAQLLYPSNRTLPFASVANEPYGLKTRDQVDERLRQQFHSANVAVQVADETTKLSLEQIGAQYQEDGSLVPVMQYPWWQRLLPFSIVIVRPSADEFSLTIDKNKLQKTIDTQHKKMQRQPRHATIHVSDGEDMIVPEKPGATVDKSRLKKVLMDVRVKTYGTTTVQPRAKILPATRTSDDIKVLLAQTKEILSQPLQLKYAKKQLDTVEPKTFGDWMIFKENGAKKLTLDYDKKKIAQYLQQQYAKTINKPAGVTNIKTLDGVEVARVDGEVGRGIDGSASALGIATALSKTDSRVANIITKPIKPRKEYDRSYTPTPRGVAAYARETAESANIAIAVDGPGGSGFGKADQSMTAASTYKIFVAVMLLHKIDAKDIKNSDKIAGTSVDVCLERMIVESDNPCAEAFIDKLGRSDLNEFFYSRGYSRGTSFTDPTTAKTTAQDLLKLLDDIQSAKDLKPASRDILLGLMKRQQYRQGIPAGTSASVANKVGFLNSVLNDAGIVEHSGGAYRLVILTDGQSWQKIAQITKKLESLMYP